jgi:hypothetical protein
VRNKSKNIKLVVTKNKNDKLYFYSISEAIKIITGTKNTTSFTNIYLKSGQAIEKDGK